MERNEDNIIIYDNYDKKKAKKLIGKKINMQLSDYTITDLVYDHFVLIRDSDNYVNFTHPKYVFETIEDKRQKELLTEDNRLQKVFDKKGILERHYSVSSYGSGRNYAFGGDISGFLNQNGAMLHTILIMDNINEFGFRNEISGDYCHTYRIDDSKPYGLYLKQSSTEIDFDSLSWIKREDFVKTIMNEFKKKLNDYFSSVDEFYFQENKKKSNDEDQFSSAYEIANFYFWPTDSKATSAYRVTGSGKLNADNNLYYRLEMGDIQKKFVEKRISGLAKIKYGSHFTLSKSTTTILKKKDIVDKIVNLMQPCVEAAFELTKSK